MTAKYGKDWNKKGRRLLMPAAARCMSNQLPR
jgi:hypothetical protein